jgi:hypothetical protein
MAYFMNISLWKRQSISFQPSLATTPGQTSFSPLFVPLFYNMALQSTTCQQLYYILDGNISIPVVDQSTAGTIYSLKNANNQYQFFPLTRRVNNKTMLYPSVSELSAGYWMLMANDREVDNASFNFNRIESEIDCFAPDENIG